MNAPISPARPIRSERTIILLLAAVQFINVLEFMIVLPLGPDFARAIDIAPSHLGLIGGSYTAAAAISGLVASTFVERFDRRKALAFAMGGLVIVTIGAGLAVDLTTMLFARVLAGCFGGPASSLSLAIVADMIPPERRGKAIGTVMGSFAIASVLGVPAALELAQVGGWRSPFFAVALLGMIVVFASIAMLPSMTKHMEKSVGIQTGVAATAGLWRGIFELMKRPVVRSALVLTSVTMMGSFMLIPNIAAYVQYNLGYPRDKLSLLYLVGGGFTFASMRLVGWSTDRYGSLTVGTIGTVLCLCAMYFGFVHYVPAMPVMAIFALFMVASSSRNVPFQALVSRVPGPQERARYMSVQSSVMHISTACGAFLASQLLTEDASGKLGNIELVAWIAIAISACYPFVMMVVLRRLKAEREGLNVAMAT